MPFQVLRTGAAPAVLALLLLSATWGYNFVVMKQVLAYVDPFDFTALRTLFGALALFAFARLSGRRLPVPGWRPVVLLGLLQTAVFGALIQWALVGGEAGRTVMLVYSMPFWLVALAAVFLGERMGAGQWVAVGAAAAGLLLILQPWSGDAPGRAVAGLGLLAGAVWAVSAVIARRALQSGTESLLGMTAWQMLFGAAALCLFALGRPSEPIVFSGYFWLALLYSAALATGLAWLLWLFILERLSAGGAGLSTLLVPVVGIVASWIELGERPDRVTGLGMLVVLAALLILAAASRPPAAPRDGGGG